MASNGLLNRAKTGTCRMCQRVRKTDKYLKTVGEVRRGYATGHIWECKSVPDCEMAIKTKLNSCEHGLKVSRIKTAQQVGRYAEYVVVV